MYKKTLKTLSLILLAIVFALCAGAILPSGGTARAGADTETIFIPAIDPSYAYPNADRGIPYIISCHPDAVKLTYTFDNWIEDKTGEITLYENPVTFRMENVLFDTDGNITQGEYFVIRENGFFEFTSKLVNEDEETLVVSSLEVNSIDYMAPKLDMSAENLLLEGSRPVGYEFKATDNHALQKFTAKSGLDTVIIFYDKDNGTPDDWDVPDKDKLTAQDIESSPSLEVIKSAKEISKAGAVNEKFFTFNFKGDGGYWIFLRDRAGNSRAERIWVQNSGIQYLVNIDGVDINVAPLFDIVYDQIEAGRGKYKEEIIFNLEKARYDLIYAFQTEKSEAERRAAYNELRSAQREYSDAKAVYVIDIVNGDMYPFDITVTNLGQGAVKALLGETIKAEITITESTGGDWFERAKDASGVLRANKIYKLSYRLTKDGSPIVPSEPVKFRVTMPLSYEKTAIIAANSAGGYDQISFQRGGEWLEFSGGGNSKDYIFAVYDSGKSGAPDLLWLYITLGALGAAGIAAGIYFGLRYRKIKKGKAIEAPQDKPEENPEIKEKKPRQNKSKKKSSAPKKGGNKKKGK